MARLGWHLPKITFLSYDCNGDYAGASVLSAMNSSLLSHVA